MSLLTVKHIEASGYENIQQAHSVSFYPKKVSMEGTENPRDEFIAFGCTAVGGATDEHGVCRYGSGRVYVMNDAGSTIAKYDLN